MKDAEEFVRNIGKVIDTVADDVAAATDVARTIKEEFKNITEKHKQTENGTGTYQQSSGETGTQTQSSAETNSQNITDTTDGARYCVHCGRQFSVLTFKTRLSDGYLCNRCRKKFSTIISKYNCDLPNTSYEQLVEMDLQETEHNEYMKSMALKVVLAIATVIIVLVFAFGIFQNQTVEHGRGIVQSEETEAIEGEITTEGSEIDVSATI